MLEKEARERKQGRRGGRGTKESGKRKEACWWEAVAVLPKEGEGEEEGKESSKRKSEKFIREGGIRFGFQTGE